MKSTLSKIRDVEIICKVSIHNIVFVLSPFLAIFIVSWPLLLLWKNILADCWVLFSTADKYKFSFLIKVTIAKFFPFFCEIGLEAFQSSHVMEETVCFTAIYKCNFAQNVCIDCAALVSTSSSEAKFGSEISARNVSSKFPVLAFCRYAGTDYLTMFDSTC